MLPLAVKPALVEQVYERLVAAIGDGQLAPGERLAQEALAERLSVSRQPVSHALALLKAEGLAVEHGRRGLVVAPLDARHLRHLYEVRAALDGVAARLAAAEVAAGRVTAPAMATLHAMVARGEAAARTGDAAALVSADAAFHRTVNEMSGNPVLIETAEKQWLHMRRAMGAVLAEPAIRARIWREHAAIAHAVTTGDAPRAEDEARNHAARAGAEAHARLAEATTLTEEMS